MSWPIPEIPRLRVVAPVRYGLWGIILLLMLAVGIGMALVLAVWLSLLVGEL